MAKIILSSDSTCDLSQELVEELNVNIIPLIVNLEGKEYYDGVNINSEDIYSSVEKTGNLPKTSAVSIGELLEYYDKIRDDENDIILHFSISSKFSSTFQNATLAASEAKNIYVIDSYNLSTGIGLQILEARRLINKGLAIDEIVKRINEYKERVDASFIIDKLDYLIKGGRCSSATGLVANIFNLKPCIEVKDGAMGSGKKYRGNFNKVLNKYISDKLIGTDVEIEEVFITHAGVEDEIVNEVCKKVESLNIFNNIYVTRAGSTVSSHCGRNTLGVLFVRKEKK